MMRQPDRQARRYTVSARRGCWPPGARGGTEGRRVPARPALSAAKCPFCRGSSRDRAARRPLRALQDRPAVCAKWPDGERFSFVRACVSPLNYEGACARRRSCATNSAARPGMPRSTAASLPARCARSWPGAYDLVTWVPLSRKRLRERGYDQARLLARVDGEGARLSAHADAA